MLDQGTTVRLLSGLVALVYGYVAVVSGAHTRRALTVAAIGLVPLAVWVIAPALLATAAFDASAVVRRAGLLAATASVGLRYAAMRSGARSRRDRWLVRGASALILLGGLAVATANWLVAAAVLVSAVALAVPNPSGASSRADREPRPDPPDG